MEDAMDVDVPKVEEKPAEEEEVEVEESTFKKPIFIDKSAKKCGEGEKAAGDCSSDVTTSGNLDTGKGDPQQVVPLNYVEPEWAGLPPEGDPEVEYSLEVLKSGVILQKIQLSKKSYWVFGRLASCDVFMAHPTISRQHVVLQYRSQGAGDQPAGFYIYDLGSTHGTFLNKCRIKPQMYVRMQVGHMLRLGCSTRAYILAGPSHDIEPESELSVTELRQLRAERDKSPPPQNDKGIDWGMGEDADEEIDLADNPYAESNNEQLYLDDPKRALRGFMEREGHELRYEVSERGPGHFLCTVELPVEDPRGRPLVAEALVRGKKKEAVVQCALEACRLLDRHGLLRQATRESRKRKAKDWAQDDYYDSDEDTFLDRTGTIERKREQRMRAHNVPQTHTHQSLLARHQELTEQIRRTEEQLESALQTHVSTTSTSGTRSEQVDSLDQYMNELNTAKSYDKYTVAKLKRELASMQKELSEVARLVNVTRPADLPPLQAPQPSSSGLVQPSTSAGTAPATRKPNTLPLYGKRLKVKVTKPVRKDTPLERTGHENDDDDDDEDDTAAEPSSSTNGEVDKPAKKETIPDTPQSPPPEEEPEPSSSTTQHQPEQTSSTASSSTTTATTTTTTTRDQDNEDDDDDEEDVRDTRKGIIEQLEIKVALCDERALASLDNKVKIKISKTVSKLRKIAEEEESIVVDEKRLAVHKKKIFEQLSSADARDIEKHLKLSHALSKMTGEFCVIGDRKLKIVEEINRLADDINSIAVEVRAASQAQRDSAVDRMKQFVEKTHRQQAHIFKQLERLHESVADQNVLAHLTDLYRWLCDQKVHMIENLETLKTTKITENSQLLKDIIQFEIKSDNFVTTILKELKKIRKTTKGNESEEDEQVPQSSDKPGEEVRDLEQCGTDEDYSTWVPPEGQTGDGRTALNDKFGY